MTDQQAIAPQESEQPQQQAREVLPCPLCHNAISPTRDLSPFARKERIVCDTDKGGCGLATDWAGGNFSLALWNTRAIAPQDHVSRLAEIEARAVKVWKDGCLFMADEYCTVMTADIPWLLEQLRTAIAPQGDACPSCDGTGEFQGGRMMLQKPACRDCNGSGSRAPQGDAGDVAERCVAGWQAEWELSKAALPHLTEAIAAALAQREQAARAEERERCVRIAENSRPIALHVAAAIRTPEVK